MINKCSLFFFLCAFMAVSVALDYYCDPYEEMPTYYPHETNCSLFYECCHGELCLKECWPGTVFNPEINVCDHPYNVDCVTVEAKK